MSRAKTDAAKKTETIDMTKPGAQVVHEEMLTLVAACAAIAERSHEERFKCIAVLDACAHVAATDQEVSLQSVGFDWQADWRLLPAGRLLAVLRAIGVGQLMVWEWKGEALTITVAGATFVLQAMPKGDFAWATHDVPAAEHAISGKKFAAAIDTVAHAVATESAKFALTGICMDEWSLIGCDGRRVSVVGGGPSEGGRNLPPFVFPTRAAKLIRTLFGSIDEVFMSATDTHLMLLDERCQMRARLIEGRYPDWRAIMPRISNHTVMIDTALALAALAKVMTLAPKENRRLSMSFGLNTMEFGIVDIDCAGQATASISVVWDGPKWKTMLNPDYLAQALRAAKEPLVNLLLTTSERPILIEAENLRELIMPLI